MNRPIVNPLGQEPEEKAADECARCDRAWEVIVDGVHLCHECAREAQSE